MNINSTADPGRRHAPPSVRKSLLLIVAGSALTIYGIQPAFSQGACMQDNWQDPTLGDKSSSLNCTAKEVFIEEDAMGNKIIDVDIIDGCEFPGDEATVNITADIHFNSDRWDVGVYSALDGGDAQTGTCAVDIIPTFPAPADDKDGDICGDVTTPGGGGANLTDFDFQTLTLTCIDDDGDGFLDFPTCFSWRTKGNNEVCTGGDDIYPGTPSKCFCERVNIDVPVPPVMLQLEKEVSTSPAGPWGESATLPEGDDRLFHFRVSVTNPSMFADVTLNDIVDDILDDEGPTSTDLVEPSDFSGIFDCTSNRTPGDGVLEPGETVVCIFPLALSGNAGEAIPDRIFVSGTDTEGRSVNADDPAGVNFSNEPSAITVEKSVSQATVLEPGAPVDYTYVITNVSSVDTVFITSADDDQLGSILNDCGKAPVATDVPGVGNVPAITLVPGESTTCNKNDVFIGSNAGDSTLNTVDVIGTDDDGDPVSDSDTALVAVEDVPSMIDIVKSVSSDTVVEPGDEVDYTYVITNTSTVDTVTLDTVSDDKVGSVIGSCDAVLLAPGDSATCSANDVFIGDNAGDSVTNIVTATGTDDDGNTVGPVMDDETVNVIGAPPSGNIIKEVVSAMVTYQITIGNTSVASDPVDVDALVDSPYGNLLDAGNTAVSNNTCPEAMSTPIVSGDARVCTFDAVATDSVTDTATATLADDENVQVMPNPSDSATVELID